MATYSSAYLPYKQPQAQHLSSKPQYPGQQQKSKPSSTQPPFPGAPPLPAGMSVNAQQWQAGYWQYNPAWNPKQSSKQQHVPWIPSHHWMPQYNRQSNPSITQQQQQQQQVQHNPYKRIPRPPSAEYLATELVENPLGLTGLDEPNKYYDKVQTPWVWRPRDLDDAEEDSPSLKQSSEESPNDSRKNSENPADDHESFTAKRELQPTFSVKIVRTPDHYRRPSSGSNPSTPSRASSRESRASVEAALSARLSHLSTGSGSGSQGSIGNSNTASFDSSGSILGDQLSDEPSSILSPLIMSHTPIPGSTPLRGLRSHYTHPIISHGLEPIPEATNSNDSNLTPSKRKDRRPAPVGHSSSLPIIPSSGMSYANSQPPRDKDRGRKEKRDRQERLGSRHTTFIDPHTSNPYSSNPINSARSASPATPSSQGTPSSHQSSALPSPSPVYPSSHVTSPSSYSRPSSPQHKPKQSPPDDYFTHSHSGASKPKPLSNSSSVVVPIIPLPPPPHSLPYLPRRASHQAFDNRRRRGFWNRRGDHLTLTGYVVYAPLDKQFPPELRNYPAEDEGFENHDGIFTANATRPELPKSVSRSGKPAENPYENFVIYETE